MMTIKSLKPIPYKKFIKFVEFNGFEFVKQEGSHMKYSKPGVLRL
jgi:predicted RNA binding protein YcfA (HicA-like mRNA interferase family)